MHSYTDKTAHTAMDMDITQLEKRTHKSSADMSLVGHSVVSYTPLSKQKSKYVFMSSV